MVHHWKLLFCINKNIKLAIFRYFKATFNNVHICRFFSGNPFFLEIWYLFTNTKKAVYLMF